ncbi:hypothetical protein GCM10011351_05160 [Paraliobacillus quinghaiensis]|uniref:Putative aromatic acid exporter C-terminal domain-containing protein n=1 Tax=Paraliobacillus quinghaiensis TaxID=470815 RepID=A0A917TG56_9BACI|nr:aromatic acid exporter family protein [Paraliobacillus quinghaiensis]GGM22244.1 hypothetical protein GCM10011351_05160 [Paraliobacillus quinghaiensis]
MRIGYRTIKTAVATPLAIWIAELMQLDNFVSAGIIAVLCIQTTRKRSFLSAWHRFGACLIAMLYGFIIFEIVGYHPISIGLLMLVFIPTTIKLCLTPGIVTSSVILLHLYSSSDVTWALVWNELLLISIGIGTALLLNLYMPSLDSKLQVLRKKVERNFQLILEEIAFYLHEGKQTWTGKEITETERLLLQADLLVSRDAENHLLREEHPYQEYFNMRKKQFELIKRMLPIISQMSDFNEQSDRVGSFFDDLAESVDPSNSAYLHLETVENLKKQFQADDLPKTRQEFESRANLFQVLHEIEEFIEIKKEQTPKDITNT